MPADNIAPPASATRAPPAMPGQRSLVNAARSLLAIAAKRPDVLREVFAT